MDVQGILSSRWFRRLRSYIIINGSLLSLGLLLHISMTRMTRLMILPSYVPAGIEILLILKNWLLLVCVDYATSHRRNIGNAVAIPRGRIEWIAVAVSVVKFSIQESLTYRLSLWCGLIAVPHTSFPLDNSIDIFLQGYLTFIGISFVFEILFDFLHYWGHRLLHEFPYLYRNFHLAHHKNANPTVYHTFEDTIGGNIVTNCIPHLISLVALVLLQRQPISHCQHAILLVYKSFVEVSGHSGKDVGGASSFPQCKWLPTLLGIELYTQDHHTHHRNSKTNFSKRFSIWDKLFGTLQSSDITKRI